MTHISIAPPIEVKLIIQDPILLGVTGQQAVISAYDIAVKNGFVGTESEWLASRGADKGETGDQGIQGIQGIKGDTGDQGIQGIKGETGDQGIQGNQGIKGETGDQGNQGIKGETGDQGIQGNQGIQGATGTIGESNIVTSGNILRADGTLFKSISEVEFLTDYEKFEKSPLSIMFPTGSKGPILWGLPNAPYSGQVPSAGFDNIQNPFFCTIQTGGAFSFAVEMLVQLYVGNNNFIYFAIGKDSNNYLLIRISRVDITVSRKLNAVTTVLSTTTFIGVNKTQQYARITIQFSRTSEIGSITSTFFPQISLPTPVNANNDFNFFGFGADEFSGSNGIEKVVVYGDRIISIP